ncbi:DNA-directed RNA polymerase I subunit RPA49 [Desmophyllum pertusum]|uniref:DNA-directed RNA polymerase I subunit RPA49 n=1 Tax=Desmophyllum pertusum TaxID=174260 RepID=A0A9W9Z017_9CNID|nr:DNA-directed RNA polymerase I subunit RPA49 [Desmophyllum pertusum]
MGIHCIYGERAESDLLTEAFGSNKRKRALTSRIKINVNEEELSEAVSSVVDITSQGKQPDTNSLSHYSFGIPSFTRSSLEIKSANKAKITEWRNENRLFDWITKRNKRTDYCPCLLWIKEKTRVAPKRLKDKLLSYILVLALMIDEFSLDCTVIGRDLQMSMSRFTNHLRAIGCIVKTSNAQRKRKLEDTSDTSSKTSTAVLQVPLPANFPNSIFRGR